MEDVPLLVEYFIDKFNKLRGKAVQGVDQEALEALMFHDFPGNIRELENVIEHAFVLCSEGLIGLQHLPGYLSRSAPVRGGHSKADDPVKSAEARVIMGALKRHHYNRKAAAAALGIHKSTLFRKINKLGLQLPEKDGRSENAEIQP